jgi:zinc transporter 1/2/3
MTPFILMIGLGVHAIFEGISLGMSKDLDSTLLLAIAIVLHKGAAGMSLGISMGRTFPGQDKFVIQLLVCFALFTPVGVAFGWALE